MKRIKALLKNGLKRIHHIKTLVIENNKVKGEFKFPVAEGEKKKVPIVKKIAKQFGVNKKEIVAVGDGTSDYDMLKYAEFSIAFFPTSEKVREIADFIMDNHREEYGDATVLVAKRKR